MEEDGHDISQQSSNTMSCIHALINPHIVNIVRIATEVVPYPSPLPILITITIGFRGHGRTVCGNPGHLLEVLWNV